MELGKINRLRVLRETDIAYLLTDGLEEVFLHKKEAKKPYEDYEEIDVFIYKDNEGRLTASTKTPKLTIGEMAKLEVVGINYDYGVFLNYGLVKDLLLSKDDLPASHDLWPQIKDELFVIMKVSKARLFAQIPSRNELADFFNPENSEDIEKLEITIMYHLDEGIVGFSDEGHEVFIHRNNYRDRIRIGKKLSVDIINYNDTGNYSGKLIEQKEIMLDKDSEIILEYLKKNNGVMKFTDKSDPKIISQVFHMSKSAFKRALGRLYKEKRIELSKTQTKLKR